METDYQRLAVETDARARSNTKRIDKLETMLDAIHELAMSVNTLAAEMREMKQDQLKMDKRLEAIERRPADRWNGFITAALSALAGAIVTGLAGAVLFFTR